MGALTPLLSNDERARAERFVRPHDRDTYIVAHALVRRALSAHGPTAPAAWRFSTNAHGCPFVVDDQAGTPRLEFNLSHTTGLVALAITRGHRVGVDVERADRFAVMDGVAERHFAAAEVRDLLALPAHLRPRAFFEYWTLKEAYIKARGMGLAIPLGALRLPVAPPGGASDRVCRRLRRLTPERWQFWQAWPTGDHRLSLAVERTGPDLPVRLGLRTADSLRP
ncbi:MAG: 4'-phosphopantetheinyl transferase superfamily protein [Vicinamibacterales bacterium]